MNIGPYRFDEYIHKVRSFHGSVAPGMIIGGIMVDVAMNNLPQGEFFDVICETDKCLPDAVQLLTPCTIGNGWLKIINLSRFAVTFYNKYSGEATRVCFNLDKMKDWPEIKCWFFREKPKNEQNLDLLLHQLKEAGTQIYDIHKVYVKSYFTLPKKKNIPIKICSSCHEAFTKGLGNICLACKGNSPYESDYQDINCASFNSIWQS